ncbi:MAG: TetR/AcrR family transcriptional regulator [Moraxellaceae bacterium]|nr:TetR/AcrR family transcriptional regulator [Moraxellaceae bacterium]
MLNRPGREQRAEQKRERILEEALTVFAEKGYHGANISDIAQRLSMGHGTFYRYFRNKHDIFIELIGQVMGQLAVVVTEQNPDKAHSVEDYRSQLQGIGETFMRLHWQDPRIARLVFYEALGAGEEVRQTLERMNELTALATEAYLRNGVEKGYIRADLDVPVAARALMAMVFEACRQVVREPDPAVASQRWSATIIGLILGGITGK